MSLGWQVNQVADPVYLLAFDQKGKVVSSNRYTLLGPSFMINAQSKAEEMIWSLLRQPVLQQSHPFRQRQCQSDRTSQQRSTRSKQARATTTFHSRDYGLYGHHDESNQVPSTTPTSYHPYKTEFENSNNKNYNNDAYNTRFSETSYNNKYYNKDSYEGNQYELSDTKYTEEGYNNKYHNSYQNNYNNDAANEKYSYNNNNNKNYNAHNNRYNTYNSNAVSRYNGERQGISDTRFLEGGKYFYDVGTEMYNPTNYGDSSREVNTNNWYNNRGVNYNGYQNQEEFEDEHENFEP
ncbi:hypothetical protein JHK84_042859 [Glycine max]|nr:hypothetical protein JHK86_042639 [Glycine max]KAG5116746.1 hypothetical protein JHK84_042859 [Glycine max]